MKIKKEDEKKVYLPICKICGDILLVEIKPLKEEISFFCENEQASKNISFLQFEKEYLKNINSLKNEKNNLNNLPKYLYDEKIKNYNNILKYFYENEKWLNHNYNIS